MDLFEDLGAGTSYGFLFLSNLAAKIIEVPFNASGVEAVHVELGERLPRQAESKPRLDAPLRYLYEADPAAIRAHALSTLAKQLDLDLLGDSNGYLTSEGFVVSPWLRAYEVLHHGKADVKATKDAARRLGGHIAILKQRGAKLDLEDLKRKFKIEGSEALTLAIWPVGKSLKHTFLKPVQ